MVKRKMKMRPAHVGHSRFRFIYDHVVDFTVVFADGAHR